MPVEDMLAAMNVDDDLYHFNAANRQLKQKLSVITEKKHSIEQMAAPSGVGMEFGNVKVSDLTELEEMVKKWFEMYTKIMRTYPFDGSLGLSIDGIYPVQEFCRKLHYVRTSHEYFELGSYIQLHDLSCICIFHARIYIGGRIHWVEQKKREGRDPYAIEDRYSGRYTSQHLLISSLPKDQKWIVDWAIVPELEINCLMVLVGSIHKKHRYIDRRIDNLRQQIRYAPPKVEEATTDWTNEAMASTDNICNICTYEFGPTFSEDCQTEPAVKTACNHVLGKICLQTWMNEHMTCPYCRRELNDRLPTAARPLYREMLEERKMISELDEEVDGFFSAETKVGYGKKMETLLRKLSSRYHEATRIESALGVFQSLEDD